MHHASRRPDTVYYRMNAQCSLTWRSNITIHLGNHGKYKHPRGLRPDTNLFNLRQYPCEPIKPRDWKDLHLLPPKTVQTTSSGTLATDDFGKNLTVRGGREISLSEGNQPSISASNSSKLASLCPGRQKKPSFSKFLIDPGRDQAQPPEPPGEM